MRSWHIGRTLLLLVPLGDALRATPTRMVVAPPRSQLPAIELATNEALAPLHSTLLDSGGTRGDLRQLKPLQQILRHFGASHGGAASGGSNRGGVASGGRGRAKRPSRRALVEMPMGWGKTLLSLLTIRAMAGGEHGGAPVRTALLVTPFLKLVDQVPQPAL